MKIKKTILLAFLTFLFTWKASAQATQIRGLTVVVHSPDAPFPESADSVELMMNQPGFTGWGNNGSVRDFYLTQSAGKVLMTSKAIKVNLPNKDITNLSYYINQQYPAGFENLTIDPASNSLVMFTVLTKHGGGAWAFGPQPGNPTIKNNGQVVNLHSGNLTNYDIGQKPENSTICHELGHCVWKWPDHYFTAWSNLGNYCQMGMGGSNSSPRAINPASRLQLGWIDNVIAIGHKTYDTTITTTSNSYTTIFKYTNPSNSKEYLLIHPQRYDGQYYRQWINDYAVTDQGLSVWYVDEDGGIDLTGEEEDYFVRLVQADNLDEMHDEDAGGTINLTATTGYSNVSGDFDDLYDNVKNTFPNGTPFRWKDGGEFGLIIGNISAPGTTMTFTVFKRNNTFIARSDKNGEISPKGVVNSTNQTFTFLPNTGYEVNTVKVDGVSVTPTGNQYTLSGTGTTKTIEVTFKRKTTQSPLPSGWSKADLGTVTSAGFAAPGTDAFYIESFGTSMGQHRHPVTNEDLSHEDHGSFVYKTLNGDGTIIAHLAENNIPTRRKNKIGLMIRSSLQKNAAMALFARVPYSGVTFEYRAASGDYATGASNRGNLHKFELYSWLKLTRTGDKVTTFSSRDGVNWQLVGSQTLNLPSQVYIGLSLTGSKDGYAARAAFDNVQVINSTTSCTYNGTRLTGTIIGTAGSWNGSDATKEKAFDNNVFTYFDGPESISWTGLDLGSAYTISGIKFVPRDGLTYRMIDGKFQGSNTADFSSGNTDLFVVANDPVYDWNCVSVSSAGSFRYIRYIGPANGVGNVAEIEFFGNPANSNPSPVVTITGPASDASFNAPATISITANASDANGTISKVEFFEGTTLLGTDLSAPYSYSWTNVPAGIYSITAKATDNQGASGSHTVSNIRVVVNTSPVVNITSPAANVSYNAPASIAISATASDANGTITKVEFLNGTTLLATLTAAPYNYTWSNVPAGVYSITARATDNLGATGTYTVSNITVNGNVVADINGPNCGTNNTMLLYELSAAKRVNATNYSWWYNGAAQGVSPVAGALYSANLNTGGNFGAGQVCVGVSYNGAPYHVSYCKSVTICSGAREESDWTSTAPSSIIAQNPFAGSASVIFPDENQHANILLFNSTGSMIMETEATGSFEFGKDLKAGLYILRLNFNGRTETLKLIKQ